jgi:hypothetical protein
LGKCCAQRPAVRAFVAATFTLPAKCRDGLPPIPIAKRCRHLGQTLPRTTRLLA